MKCKVSDIIMVLWALIAIALCEVVGTNDKFAIPMFIISASLLGYYAISFTVNEIVKKRLYRYKYIPRWLFF